MRADVQTAALMANVCGNRNVSIPADFGCRSHANVCGNRNVGIPADFGVLVIKLSRQDSRENPESRFSRDRGSLKNARH